MRRRRQRRFLGLRKRTWFLIALCACSDKPKRGRNGR